MRTLSYTCELLRIRVKARLRLAKSLEAANLAVNPREERKTVLHKPRQHGLDLGDVLDHIADLLVIELERLGHIVEHADVVDDETIRLRFAVHAVRAADRLQKRMVLHRLVEIHALQDRRVEPRQKLGRDNHELERIEAVAETVQQLVLRRSVKPVVGVLAFLVVVAVHHDRRRVGRPQEHVQLLLVRNAVLTVEHDDLAFHAGRLDLAAVVFNDVRADLAYALRRGKEGFRTSLSDKKPLLLVGDLVGHLVEGRVQRLLVEVHFDRRGLELERQRRAVVDGVLERILAHVPV